MKKAWCAAILTALACLGGQTPPEPQLKPPTSVVVQTPPATPFLSGPGIVDKVAWIEGYDWRVEVKWAPIGKLPVEPIRLREIGSVLTQAGLIQSNRYALIMHGTNRTDLLIDSVLVAKTNRTFQHVVVRKFSDGTVELAD